jgi:tRNA nucleotidyltransferase (CCA-adding enzyme)
LENFKLLVKPFEKVINTITLAGGRFIFVGGCVRDVLMNRAPKDADAEVYGIPLEKLKQALQLVDIVSEVGKQFGVLKLKKYAIDISLPRFDTKTGPGHKGFSVKVDYSIPFRVAAKRRDLTINAIGFDPIKEEILDPYNGLSDIREGILRAVDPHTFVEDPLRGLRVAQFAARFLMEPHSSLIMLCQKLNIKELPLERISDEMKKLLLRGQKPSKGLIFLKDSFLLEQFFPVLNQLEKEKWEEMLDLIDRGVPVKPEAEDQALLFMMSLLCCPLRVSETEAYLRRCIMKDKLKEGVLVLLNHGKNLLETQHSPPRADLFWIGQALYKKGLSWTTLLLFLKTVEPTSAWVTDLSKKVLASGACHPKNLDPVVTGEHLIKKGFRPGKKFTELLNQCIKIQYEQGITDPNQILKKIL